MHGKLNMAMGAMMLGIAGIQLSQPVISTPRYIFIAICVLLGGYNFYAGYKNWKEFSRQRGYTPKEIAHFERWLELAGDEKFKPYPYDVSPENIHKLHILNHS